MQFKCNVTRFVVKSFYMKLLYSLCLVVLISNHLLAQEIIAPSVKNEAADVTLKQLFTKYEIVSIDVPTIQKLLSSKGVYHKVNIQLGNNKKWTLDLFEYDLMNPDYYLQLAQENNNRRIPKDDRIKTYHCSLNAAHDAMSSITIADHFFYGYIIDHGIEYFFEPLSGLVENAPKDQMIFYQSNDAIINPNVKSAVIDAHENRSIVLSQNNNSKRSVPACYGLNVAIANDYTVYQKRGTGTEAWCIGLLSNVATLFDNEFLVGIELNLSTVFIATDTATDPWDGVNNISTHLDVHKAWGNAGGYGSADYAMAVAWSTKYTAGAVGLTWIGALCNENKYMVLSDFGGAPNYLRALQTHNTGHICNAQNDIGPNTIMGSCVCETWSNQSINVISAFVENASCAIGCSTLGNPPVASFKVSNTTLCISTSNTVQFTDLSTENPYQWEWSFPGGTPSASNLKNPSVVYKTRGVYDVTLKVTNVAGTDIVTINQMIDVEVPPVSAFDVQINESDITTKNNSKYGSTYIWKFGDGEISSDFEPIHTYKKEGVYNLTLEVINRCGSTKKTIKVTIAAQNIANFSANTQRACAPYKVQYKNLSAPTATDYLWEFPGGMPSSSKEKVPPEIEYTIPGTYDVKLTASNATTTMTKVNKNFISIDAMPSPSFSTSITGIQVLFTNTSQYGNTYEWNFGDDSTSTEASPIHQYNKEGEYNVRLKVHNSCGTVELLETVTVLLIPKVDFTVEKNEVCAGDAIKIIDASSKDVKSWFWQFEGANKDTSSVQYPTIVYHKQGTYSVKLAVKNSNGTNQLEKQQFIKVVSPVQCPDRTKKKIKLNIGTAD